MNLNGLVLNLSPSGLCVHLVVELQPAAESKPHRKSPHRQSSPLPARKRACVCKKKMQTAPPKDQQKKKINKTIPKHVQRSNCLT